MKNIETENILIIGIGNYGRQDDGLGWRFLDLLVEKGCPYDTEYRYQLQIEDAELISRYDKVIFIDATIEDLNAEFSYSNIKSEYSMSYTSHAIPPGQVLHLCAELYEESPEAYMVAIKGYDFNLKHGLSKKAGQSLKVAFGELAHILLLN